MATDREEYMTRRTSWLPYPTQKLKHKHDDIEAEIPPSDDQVLATDLDYNDN